MLRRVARGAPAVDVLYGFLVITLPERAREGVRGTQEPDNLQGTLHNYYYRAL